MKDIDFDEIDRAVNSFISNTSGNDTDSNSPKPEVPVDNPQVKPTAVQTPPLAGRRGGQFMDMVRISPAPRATPTPVQQSTAAVPVSSQSVIIEPVSKEEPPVSVTPNVVDKPDDQVLPPVNLPDPIDFSESINKQQITTDAPKPTENKEDVDIDKINDGITNELNGQSGLPDSPFISDARVEKRPLGAFSGGVQSQNVEPSAVQPEMEPSKTVPEASGGVPVQDSVEDEQKPVVFVPSNERDISSPDMDTPLPAELRDDLLSIESDSTTNPKVVQSVAEDKPPASQPANQPLVPQQAQTTPSSNDQKTGSIYDTDSYHNTLLHPKKKKSGWLWVLWIALLLAVGAGAGAAVYYFVISRL